MLDGSMPRFTRSADYRRIPKLEARRGSSVIVAPTYEWLVTAHNAYCVRDIDACIHVHIVKVEINPRTGQYDIMASFNASMRIVNVVSNYYDSTLR